MSSGAYKLGYCIACRRNVQHFRGKKTMVARWLDLASLYVLNFGPWYCSHCESHSRCLPWFRRKEPTLRRIDSGSERIGNFLRSDGSLVLRHKRSSRYSTKFREGVVLRLLTGKTNMAQLTTELNVTEADLLSWVNDMLVNKDDRIEELTSLLKSYHRAAGDLIGIANQSTRFDEEEKMIEGQFKQRMSESRNFSD